MSWELRRAQRRASTDTVVVTDAMTDAPLGTLGNLSATGMLLIANRPLPEDGLFQLRFALEPGAPPIEVGCQILWIDQAAAPGQYWTGLRFICVAGDDVARIRAWACAPAAGAGQPS